MSTCPPECILPFFAVNHCVVSGCRMSVHRFYDGVQRRPVGVFCVNDLNNNLKPPADIHNVTQLQL